MDELENLVQKEKAYRHMLEIMVGEYGLAECIIMLGDAVTKAPNWQENARGLGKLYALGFDLQGE